VQGLGSRLVSKVGVATVRESILQGRFFTVGPFEKRNMISIESQTATEDNDETNVQTSYWFTLACAVLFFGVGAVQQYIAVWFQERGLPHVGKNTLVLVYLFYFLGAFQAHRVINFLGCRTCMMATSLVYGALILSIWSGSELLSYLTAAMSGLMASLLWTGQTIVLNQISDSNLRSIAVGQFWTRYPLGTGLGTLTLGMLIGRFAYSIPILCFSLFAIVSFFLFWQMPNKSKITNPTTKNRFPSFHAVTVGTALTVFFVRFIYALVISQVPIDLKDAIGTTYVGLVTSPFFLLTILVSKPVTIFAHKRGFLLTACLGLIVSGLGIACLLLPQTATSLTIGVLLIALTSAALNPIGNLLPKWVTDFAPIDLPRIAGTFSLAASSGILAGLLSVRLVSRTNAYVAAIGLLLVSAVSLWLVARVAGRRVTLARP
jgi:hypothetical protein